jgi:glycerol-3-phosphate dehydrogenase
VRPVVDDGQQAASKATRDHVVRDESGLITLTGGKLTTFRLMAQDALASWQRRMRASTLRATMRRDVHPATP